MDAPELGDRYRVRSRLGAGGMAIVYLASDARLRRDVAVKVLQEGVLSDKGLYFFHREARAIAALKHPNIVQVFDYSGPDESPPYLVMELVDGHVLADVAWDLRPLPEPFIVAVAAAVASALEHAHSRGVIHRDIKPSNVMLDRDGRVVLADFGVAKAYDEPKKLGTTLAGRATGIVGTPSYMAPEQVLEQAVGPPADMFAFGALVYSMAVARSPFSVEGDVVECMRRIIDSEYEPLARARPDTSKRLQAVVERCLLQQPEARLTAAAASQRCDELLLELGHPRPQRLVAELLRSHVSATVELEDEPAGATAVLGLGPQRAPPPTPDPPTVPLGRELATSTVWEEDLPTERDDPHASQPASGQTSITELPPPHAATPPSRRRGARLPAVAVAVTLLLLAVGAVTWLARAPEPRVTQETAAASDLGEAASGTTSAPGVAPTPVAAPPVPIEPVAAPQPAEATTGVAIPIVEDDAARARAGKETSGTQRKRRAKRSRSGPADLRRGTVEIVVRPWGTIFIDGIERGNTPLVGEVDLRPGEHRIEARHPSLGRQVQTVVIVPGERRKVSFDLGS